MSDVCGLGYLGIDAIDLASWRTFATDLLGLQIGDGSDANDLYLRVDERSWRFHVQAADRDGLSYVGWEVPDSEALERILTTLRASGIDVSPSPELAQQRRVRELLKCEDPNGVQLEFFYGAHMPQTAFVSPLGHEFVTGDLGLGHIVLLARDLAATKKFYLDALGFELTDIVGWKGGDVVFTHVNRRHHSLAFAEVPDVPDRLGHFMLQVTDIDKVGRALDKVLNGAAPLTQTFGRHTNDHMMSFYCQTPSGFEVEFGTSGRVLDDNWVVSYYDEPSYWGHKPLAGSTAV